jgi:aminoglycoside-2''-adenylyltransferase
VSTWKKPQARRVRASPRAVACDRLRRPGPGARPPVISVTAAAGTPAWLFGGWGLDARIGRVTREHGDVEFWVERIHAERSKAALMEAGVTALTTQPPEEACEFTWDDVPFSTAYFDRRPDGSISQPLGRFSDWLFPPDSFGDKPGCSMACRYWP